ncbi:MAG: hypothetical protein JNM56_36735 [Planctomycetia bacterium]|nr:hypothetical protein [Planctomycetia bacterium]
MQTHQASSVRGPRAAVKHGWSEVAAFSLSHADESTEDAVPRVDDPGVRSELVRRVRREIAAGTYDTPEKFEAALERMLDDLD